VVLDESTPKPYAYLLSHFSKAIIKQAENEVSAKAEAGFPLARVIVGLFLRGHAALSEILFARLVKKCPWVIPYYPSKQAVSLIGNMDTASTGACLYLNDADI
jgi:nucleoporin GLE1